MKASGHLLYLFTVSLLILSAVSLCTAEEEVRLEARTGSPGSLLVFPKFDIRGTTNTDLRITNHSHQPIRVALNFICPGEIGGSDYCAKLDVHEEFTPFQTRVVDVADQNPPCEQGFVLGWSETFEQDPISHNHLHGSYHIRSGVGLESDSALTIQSVRPTGEVLGTEGRFQFGSDPSPETQDFPPISDRLFTDFQSTGTAQNAPHGSHLILLDLDVLIGQQNARSVVAVDFWNEAEVPFSSSHEFICWDEIPLEDIDQNFFKGNLGSRFGALKLEALENCPVPGGCPPLNLTKPNLLGVIQEYHDGTRALRGLFSDVVLATPPG